VNNGRQDRETEQLLRQLRRHQTGANDFDLYDSLDQREQLLEQLPPPSEADIATLMALGFDRPAVLRALQSAGNNVDAAANILVLQ